ncbi:MAG: hypothetical protein AAF459_13780, partial [Pseudomonadota bacterium]
KNVKTIPGELQHSLVVMDVLSSEMGREKREVVLPRRRTWKLRPFRCAFFMQNTALVRGG